MGSLIELATDVLAATRLTRLVVEDTHPRRFSARLISWGMAATTKQPRGDEQLLAWIGEPNEHGCRPWLGPIFKATGYGRWRSGRKVDTTAHRAVWEHFRGPIPEGLTLDHVRERCGGGKPNRLCVNLDHLEAVTNEENVRRGDHSHNGWNHRDKTHCINGHELAGDNLRISPMPEGRGWTRVCRACTRERMRRYRADV